MLLAASIMLLSLAWVRIVTFLLSTSPPFGLPLTANALLGNQSNVRMVTGFAGPGPSGSKVIGRAP